ncbi:hypothetical protein ACFP63_08870 [Oerskovia jenensis]|uniref:Transcriptional regulator with XRE-family HTH domain n=1 Tax=Oerskovia jenensis TaxID=162169 RepID=A0ABS2LIC0_9CELL|nr:hypothetical protein [Oerskovia jenensis]MBM7480166.1 transcriptional regulator with XRE-family HTH domain [Oerskovia jenensis]
MTNDEPQTLREVAQLASDRNGGARGRELGRIAEAAGLTLSYTTVDRILSGKYFSRPAGKTLEALATLSGVPLERVHEVAGVPLPLAPLAEQLPPDADSLSPEQRSVVLGAIRQFAELNRALESARQVTEVVGNAEHPAPMNDAPKMSATVAVGADELAHRRASRETDVPDPATFIAAHEDDDLLEHLEAHEEEP